MELERKTFGDPELSPRHAAVLSESWEAGVSMCLPLGKLSAVQQTRPAAHLFAGHVMRIGHPKGAIEYPGKSQKTSLPCFGAGDNLVLHEVQASAHNA